MRMLMKAKVLYMVIIVGIPLAVKLLRSQHSSADKYDKLVKPNQEESISDQRGFDKNANQTAQLSRDRSDELLLVKEKEIGYLKDELRRMKIRFEMLLSNKSKRENRTSDFKFVGNKQSYNSADQYKNSAVKDPIGRGANTTAQSSILGQVGTNSAVEIPKYRADGVDCRRLFAGDAREAARAKVYNRDQIKPAELEEMAQNCQLFQTKRSYVMKALNKEEEEYPIAFSIVMHDEVAHFERLLRAIYRPQNHYCIHLDKKAHDPVRRAVEAIVFCLPNVFMSSRSVDVEWGRWTVVEPELICMEDLFNRSASWRYFINLTGQEFPLKTNWDLVKILKAFNGSNNMEGTVERRDDSRFTSKPRVPVPVTLTKGSVHIVVTRDFVRYVLYNKDVQLFKEWVKDTYVPDETFFSSLNHSPQLGVPGAYLGKPETDTESYMFVARFKNWGDGPFNWPCHGQRVRYVCIFGVGDLPLLASRPELFANKFYVDYQPGTLDCMEELHYNRTRDEMNGVTTFDTSFYQRLAFVSNHI